jgi:hypothetical protein
MTRQMLDLPGLDSNDKNREQSCTVMDWASMARWRRALFYAAVALLLAGAYRIVFVSNPDRLGLSLIILSSLVLLLSMVGLKGGGYRESGLYL